MFDTLIERLRPLRGTMVRALAFGLAWAILPSWLFVILALYLFFVPPAQAGTVIVPFIVLLGLALLTPGGSLLAVVFGLLFWYILLIKELYLIDRKTAYEVLSFVLVFLVFRLFYDRLGGGADAATFFFAALAAIVTGMLFSSFIAAFMPDRPAEESGNAASAVRRLRRVASATIAFLVFEILLAGLFLPLDFIYQTAVTFLIALLLMDLAARHLLEGPLSRERILIVSGTVGALLVILLGSAAWTL